MIWVLTLAREKLYAPQRQLRGAGSDEDESEEETTADIEADLPLAKAGDKIKGVMGMAFMQRSMVCSGVVVALHECDTDLQLEEYTTHACSAAWCVVTVNDRNDRVICAVPLQIHDIALAAST